MTTLFRVCTMFVSFSHVPRLGNAPQTIANTSALFENSPIQYFTHTHLFVADDENMKARSVVNRMSSPLTRSGHDSQKMVNDVRSSLT